MARKVKFAPIYDMTKDIARMVIYWWQVPLLSSSGIHKSFTHRFVVAWMVCSPFLRIHRLWSLKLHWWYVHIFPLVARKIFCVLPLRNVESVTRKSDWGWPSALCATLPSKTDTDYSHLAVRLPTLHVYCHTISHSVHSTQMCLTTVKVNEVTLLKVCWLHSGQMKLMVRMVREFSYLCLTPPVEALTTIHQLTKFIEGVGYVSQSMRLKNLRIDYRWERTLDHALVGIFRLMKANLAVRLVQHTPHAWRPFKFQPRFLRNNQSNKFNLGGAWEHYSSLHLTSTSISERRHSISTPLCIGQAHLNPSEELGMDYHWAPTTIHGMDDLWVGICWTTHFTCSCIVCFVSSLFFSEYVRARCAILYLHWDAFIVFPIE